MKHLGFICLCCGTRRLGVCGPRVIDLVDCGLDRTSDAGLKSDLVWYYLPSSGLIGFLPSFNRSFGVMLKAVNDSRSQIPFFGLMLSNSSVVTAVCN